MFSAMSCSPEEIKIFWPVIEKLPSLFGSAFVRIRPKSVPHCGSVRFIVPVHSHDAILGKYMSFWPSVPWAKIADAAPCVSPWNIENDWLDAKKCSLTAEARTAGIYWPPYFSGISMPAQPPALNCSKASLKPSGVRTTPFSR